MAALNTRHFFMILPLVSGFTDREWFDWRILLVGGRGQKRKWPDLPSALRPWLGPKARHAGPTLAGLRSIGCGVQMSKPGKRPFTILECQGTIGKFEKVNSSCQAVLAHGYYSAGIVFARRAAVYDIDEKLR